jgi:hypothetical protein
VSLVTPARDSINDNIRAKKKGKEENEENVIGRHESKESKIT